MHACREEGKPFEQTLHMRVFTARGFELQTRGHLGVLLRELGPQLAQVGEFAFVVPQQIVLHQAPPATSYSPLAISSTVSKTICSGLGSMRRVAEIEKRTWGADT